MRCKGLDELDVVDALVHQKSNGPVGGRDQQQGIHKRHVIADQQGAGLIRKVIAPQDLHAIDGMGDKEENRRAEPLGEEHQDIDGSGCR